MGELKPLTSLALGPRILGKMWGSGLEMVPVVTGQYTLSG